MPQILQPTFISSADDIKLQKDEKINTIYTASWSLNTDKSATATINYNLEITDLNSILISITDKSLSNTTLNLENSANMAQKYFVVKPQNSWFCKLIYNINYC